MDQGDHGTAQAWMLGPRAACAQAMNECASVLATFRAEQAGQHVPSQGEHVEHVWARGLYVGSRLVFDYDDAEILDLMREAMEWQVEQSHGKSRAVLLSASHGPSTVARQDIDPSGKAGLVAQLAVDTPHLAPLQRLFAASTALLEEIDRGLGPYVSTPAFLQALWEPASALAPALAATDWHDPHTRERWWDFVAHHDLLAGCFPARPAGTLPAHQATAAILTSLPAQYMDASRVVRLVVPSPANLAALDLLDAMIPPEQSWPHLPFGLSLAAPMSEFWRLTAAARYVPHLPQDVLRVALDDAWEDLQANTDLSMSVYAPLWRELIARTPDWPHWPDVLAMGATPDLSGVNAGQCRALASALAEHRRSLALGKHLAETLPAANPAPRPRM